MKHLILPLALLALLFALSLSFATEQTESNKESPGAIVVQNYYYAQPGKEAEMLSWRLHVCDILDKLGCKRGRVLRRLKSEGDKVDADDPDVVWEAEFPDQDSLARDMQKESASGEFKAAREHMGTLLRKFERRRWQVQ
jgi:hypothetical protein